MLVSYHPILHYADNQLSTVTFWQDDIRKIIQNQNTS